MKVYNIKCEIDQKFYRTILQVSLVFRSRMLFVIHDEDAVRKDFLDAISPHILYKRKTRRWPGTVSKGKEVSLYCCKINKDLIETIQRFLPDLWSWMSPEFPEDPSFIREDGKPWFISITHEKDCYFVLTNDELKQLQPYIKAECLSLQGPQKDQDEQY